MKIQEFLEGLPERLRAGAGVDRVFGAPLQAGEKTIIPVARVRYGFGGGAGPSASPAESSPTANDGGGGGAGVVTVPVGVFEVTAEETKFIPTGDKKKFALAIFGSLLLGLWLGRRR